MLPVKGCAGWTGARTTDLHESFDDARSGSGSGLWRRSLTLMLSSLKCFGEVRNLRHMENLLERGVWGVTRVRWLKADIRIGNMETSRSLCFCFGLVVVLHRCCNCRNRNSLHLKTAGKRRSTARGGKILLLKSPLGRMDIQG